MKLSSSLSKEREKRLCLDFDGTLQKDPEAWDGGVPRGEPTEGAQEFIRELMDDGWEIMIATARAGTSEDMGAVILAIDGWLDKWGFERGISIVGDSKPAAAFYIDDRGVRFAGNWDEMREALKLQPWWKDLTEKLQAVPPTLAEMLRRGAPPLFSCEDDEA